MGQALAARTTALGALPRVARAPRCWPRRRTSSAPARVQAVAAVPASSSTPAATPSTSIINIAPVPVGATARPRRASTARNDTPSMSSMVAGTTRSARSPDTAATACRMLGERCAQRRLHGRFGDQAQRDLGDDRKRALRSDEQLRQVVADDVLDRLRTGADDFACWQHGFERQHVTLGGAVLDRARTTGTLRDVASNRRLLEARGIGRIEQPACFDRLLQIVRDRRLPARLRGGCLRRFR